MIDVVAVVEVEVYQDVDSVGLVEVDLMMLISTRFGSSLIVSFGRKASDD